MTEQDVLAEGTHVEGKLLEDEQLVNTFVVVAGVLRWGDERGVEAGVESRL